MNTSDQAFEIALRAHTNKDYLSTKDSRDEFYKLWYQIFQELMEYKRNCTSQ